MIQWMQESGQFFKNLLGKTTSGSPIIHLACLGRHIWSRRKRHMRVKRKERMRRKKEMKRWILRRKIEHC
ncbi:hypothetical protein Gotur_022268, partial [Gossypium turneri]